MQGATCSCSCGNIRIRGQLLPQGVYPNIIPSERDHLRDCRSLFTIQSQAIELQDPRKIQARLLSNVCADMHCSCSSGFRFFFGRGFSYFGRLPDSRQKRPAPGSQTPNQQSPEQVSTNGGPSRPPPEVHSNPSPRLSNPNNQPLPNIFMPLLSQQRTRPQQRLNLNNNRRNLNLSQNSLNLEEDAEESRIFSNNEDTDFDLMFSNNVDPVVGSYKQHMGLPADGALGNIAFADFQPKSYYA